MEKENVSIATKEKLEMKSLELVTAYFIVK